MYSDNLDYAEHELITTRISPRANLSAMIAVHNETLGPALGGCRIYPYASEALAMTDVLRLSHGMTYKHAIANIPCGGGKGVIIADPAVDKTRDLLHAFGDFVESLNGRYITSFDSGATLDDVRTIGERTRFTAGTLAEAGDASASTALGVYTCMRAAVAIAFRAQTLDGMKVAIQGLGNVGLRLARRVIAEGATAVVADPDPEKIRALEGWAGVEVVPPDEILRQTVDVLAPCALGAILSKDSIAGLKTRIIVGGANNQLATADDDGRLAEAGVLYCPDYLANAGGIIDLHYQRTGWSRPEVDAHITGLATTFEDIVEQARSLHVGTTAVANKIAERRFRLDRTR